MNGEYISFLNRLAEIFENAGEPLWLVGGAVRNRLMGLPISDLDVCGPALPKEVVALCEGTPVRAVLRAAHFGTVELHMTDEAGQRRMAEYTTFREDSYRCGHQPSSVRFSTDMGVDARRRDFSVNALYLRLPIGGAEDIGDPTGGLAHLRRGVLHTVTQDPDQVLKDDGLRILRAARFQAELGLTPTKELLASAAKYAGLLCDIARERLRDELTKILLADFRYPTLDRKAPATLGGLRTLGEMGGWPYLFPHAACSPEAAEALSALALPHGIPPLVGRLSLLLWDAPLPDLEADLRALRFAVRETEQTLCLVRAMQALAKDALPLFEAAKLGTTALAFCESAFAALAMEQPRARAASLGAGLLGKPLCLKDLAVNGDHLLPLCRAKGLPEACLGPLLSALWRQTVEEGLANRQSALLAAANQWLLERQEKKGNA